MKKILRGGGRENYIRANGLSNDGSHVNVCAEIVIKVEHNQARTLQRGHDTASIVKGFHSGVHKVAPAVVV